MGARLQLLGVAVLSWIGTGLAARRDLVFAEVILAMAAIAAGLISLLPERDRSSSG